MVNLLDFNKKIGLIFKEIDGELKYFEENLKEKNISKNFNYSKWYDYFVKIYGSRFTSLRLYILFALLYFLGYLFIIKFILKKNIITYFRKFTFEKFKKFQQKIKIEYNKRIFFSSNYFSPFFKCLEKREKNSYEKFLKFVDKELFSLDIPKEYLFDFFVQNLFSHLTRQKSGEFFTPPFLTKAMIDKTYKFGEKVLDPSCGSGNFLIEILRTIISSNKSNIEKFNAINNLYGYDINPISIFLVKINFFLLLKEEISKVNLNLYTMDFLFPNKVYLPSNFDLVIGNPPWYTLREVESIQYQSKMKDLAESLNIKPRPKNVLNLEISTLFFFKARNKCMKDRAQIFFVITKGIINGSHASLFRNFEGLSDLMIWQFDQKIEKIFNIDFVCLFAKKSEMKFQNEKLEIPVNFYSIIENNIKIKYFENLKLNLKKKDIFIPYHIEKRGNKTYIHKLVSKNEFKNLISFKPSKYKNMFHKGADLNPRNLIFVRFDMLNNSLVKIKPDERIFNRAKAPWNKMEFRDEIVEKQYIFKVIKSTELLKFFVYDFYHVFLPISKLDLNFNYSSLSKNAKTFYDKINQIYLKYKKNTTKNASLMDNLNRWSKLINPRQKANIKVVYNNSGSILNSAVIQGDYLITGDLSFYNTKTLEEAYYLSAILNSNLMNKQIRIKKSSRHIFKIPFEIPIKIYNPENMNHMKLSELGKKGQKIAESTYHNLLKKELIIPSKSRIQKMFYKKLKPLLNQIDQFLIKEFPSENNKNILY